MAAEKKLTLKKKASTKTKKKKSVSEKGMKVTSFDSLWEDLGFAPEQAAILRIKSDLRARIVMFAQDKGLTQHELSKVLNIPQPKISNIIRGKLQDMSIELLLGYAWKIDETITLQVTNRAS